MFDYKKGFIYLFEIVKSSNNLYRIIKFLNYV